MAIVTSDLTNGSISTNTDNEYQWTGDGIFDKLIEVVNNNIKVQYDNGRIKEDAYAEVYLGSIQTVIAQSMQFLLNKDKTDKEIELLTAQIAKVNADKLLTDAQKAELLANGLVDRDLKNSQIAKVNSDKLLTDTQKSELLANGLVDRNLKDSQTAKVDSDKLLVDTQKSELELNGTVDRDLKNSQISKVDADKLLVDTQKSELLLNGTADRSLKSAQAAKVTYEKDNVLPQQVINLSAQKDLYTRQKEGFDDNANQKVLDTLVNGWALAYSSGMLGADNTLTAMSDANVTAAVNRVINGTDIG